MGQIICRFAITRLIPLSLVACGGGVYETSVRDDLALQRDRYATAAPSPLSPTMQAQSAAHTPSKQAAAPRQGPAGYVALALQNHPEIRAAYERWRASVHRISKARRLPEPMLGFGYFVRSVETRVGPQQARVSLQQTFPWPSKLGAGADAASAQARASQRRFEAQALTVSRQVVTAYWDLWEVRRTRVLQREHVEIVRGLSESVRARVATGGANLAELQQVELTAARLHDSVLGLDEAERAAEGRLRAAIGVTEDMPVLTSHAPSEAVLPQESLQQLVEAANTHPMIASAGFMAEAADSSARAEAAEGLPSLTLGADWIITGEAAMPDVMDSGKDALVVAAGLRLPLWQGSYSDSVEAVRADANVQRAEQQAMVNRARGEVETLLSNVRDSVRRVQLYRDTLIHLAQSAYEAVLGVYMVGKATVAEPLLAQRDLLELQIELVRARADHARSWARLEEVTGSELSPAAEHKNDDEVEP